MVRKKNEVGMEIENREKWQMGESLIKKILHLPFFPIYERNKFA